MKTILISAYIGGDERAPKAAFFDRLDAALRARGHRLYLLNLAMENTGSRCDGSSVPLFIQKAHRLGLQRFLANCDLKTEVVDAASIDSEEWGRDPQGDAVRVLFYRACLREHIAAEDPKLCVFWHQFNSLHYSAPNVCSESGVPSLYVEYGSLPGTVAFDEEGQMAESWVARESDTFVNLEVTEQDLSTTRTLLEHLRDEKRSRKSQAQDESTAKAISDFASRGRKLIFFAGQHDYKSGIRPRTLPNAALHSPIYSSTLDALQHVCALAEERDWYVLFKPHPLVANPISDDRLPYPKRVCVVPGADIFACMKAADVTATIVSQVSYMALLHGRPCVLLGRSQLAGKGCAYEAGTRAEVGEAIENALAEGFTPGRRDAWLKHTAQMCRYALFPFDANIERFMPRNVDDIADYLIQRTEGIRGPGETGRKAGPVFGNDIADGGARTLELAWRGLGGVDRLAGRFLNPLATRVSKLIQG